MEKVNLKILSDIHCELYVDQNFITDIPKDTLTKIPLSKGEYLITLKSTINPQVKFEGTSCGQRVLQGRRRPCGSLE